MPFSFSKLKNLCKVGFLRSSPRIIVFLSKADSTDAVLIAVKDLPSPLMVDVTAITNGPFPFLTRILAGVTNAVIAF